MPDEETVPFSLRVPKPLFDRIVSQAASQRRSTNSQILVAIEASFAKPIPSTKEAETRK